MPSPDDSGGPDGPKAPWTLTVWERLQQTFARPAAPQPAPTAETVDFSKLSSAEIKRRVTQIDPTERKIGLAAAALAAVLAIASNVPPLVRRTVVPIANPTGHHCPSGLRYTTSGSSATCNGVWANSHYVELLILQLVFALAILVAIRFRRRAPLAFIVAITGLALNSLLYAVPFLAVGGWLLLRAWRTQRYGSPTAKAPLPGYVPPQRGRAAPSAGAGRAQGGRGRTTAKTTATTTRKAPEASKRYTPKRPPPKPTRAQQRAKQKQN